MNETNLNGDVIFYFILCVACLLISVASIGTPFSYFFSYEFFYFFGVAMGHFLAR